MQGDSGSGLIVMAATGPVVVGVVSYGWDCGDNRAPGVYARYPDIYTAQCIYIFSMYGRVQMFKQWIMAVIMAENP